MKRSILWKTTKQTCPLCYRLRSGVKVQDMMTLMRHMLLDGHLAEQTDTKIPQEQEVKIPPCSALLKAWPSVRSARFIDANSYAVASPLIIVGETKTNQDWQPGSINDTMPLVKQHPPLQTAQYVHSLGSYVHYFIHITVSRTLQLTYKSIQQHFHKENLMEFIYCSVQPLGHTFIYRMRWSALH